MDFEKVLPLIIQEFEKEKVNYGLIGGFAMGALGIMRSTMDLDFDVCQYIAAAKIFGEIDFLRALRPISRAMLKRSKALIALEGRLKLKVLIPEDIIGLKVQAVANNPLRETREYADIENIMDYFGAGLNWGLLRQHFFLFEMEEKFKELEQKYGGAK